MSSSPMENDERVEASIFMLKSFSCCSDTHLSAPSCTINFSATLFFSLLSLVVSYFPFITLASITQHSLIHRRRRRRSFSLFFCS